MSILKHNDKPLLDQPYDVYPPPANRTTFYLNSTNHKGQISAPMETSTHSYQSDKDGEIHFDIVFDRKTVLAGYPTLKLYLQPQVHDDMDVFVILRKLDKLGKQVDNLNYVVPVLEDSPPKVNVTFLQGPTGMIRASHRATACSSETFPGEILHPHTVEDKVTPGTIVPLQFSTWPIGTVYEPGEAVRVSISGRDMAYPESLTLPTDSTRNKGRHVLYTGGKYDSYIILPVIS